LPDIELVVTLTAARAATREQPAGPESSDLLLGGIQGLAIYTGDRGMYRMTSAALEAAGVPTATVAPTDFALWHLDRPVAIHVTGTEDGRFDDGDAIIFYAQPYEGRYMTSNVYKLTWTGPAGLRMSERPAMPSPLTMPVAVVERTIHLETDRVYYSTYRLPPDVDHFFEEALFANAAAPIATSKRTFTPTAPLSTGQVRLVARLHGGNDVPAAGPDQSVDIRVNGHLGGTFMWDGSRIYTATLTLPASVLQAGPNTVTLESRLDQLPHLSNFWVSPDWVEVTYPSLPLALADELYLPKASAAPHPDERTTVYLPLLFARPTAAHKSSIRVWGFSSPPEIFDISDANNPVRLTGFSTMFSDSYAAEFEGRLDTDSYFVATPSAMRSPWALVPDAASSWRRPHNRADYIAIVHRSLWDAVQPLLEHRSAEGLHVAKVDVQDVYDEFSGGRLDPEALRAFLTYAYHEWNSGGARPVYVLLVGDGHYDFKNAFGMGLPNLIPPYLLDVDPFIGETAADNRYACADGHDDFLPDMAIGRIPAKNPAELTAYVNKVLAYEQTTPSGAWQSRTVFVADAAYDPAGNFHALSEQSRTMMPAGYESKTVYFGASPSTDTAGEMKLAMRAAFDAGAIYLQWFGHASRQRWGSGLNNMFDLADPPRLALNTVVPFSAAYSCWSGYFINARGSPQYGNSEQSLGEALVLVPGRGSLVDLSPTGLHIGAALVKLNQEIVKAVFQQRQDRVGLAVDRAKGAFFESGEQFADLIDTQVLLGDPAIRLKLPQ
jgi:hypothetical protein